MWINGREVLLAWATAATPVAAALQSGSLGASLGAPFTAPSSQIHTYCVQGCTCSSKDPRWSLCPTCPPPADTLLDCSTVLPSSYGGAGAAKTLSGGERGILVPAHSAQDCCPACPTLITLLNKYSLKQFLMLI